MDIQLITSIWPCIAYITSYVTKPETCMSDLMRKASKEATEKGVAGRLHHVANQMRKGREVSHHEAIMRILSIPLRRSNISVVFIPTDMPENRTRVLKPQHILQNLDKQDTNIYLPSIHDKYAARPDKIESICLAEFVAYFTYGYSNKGDNKTQPHETQEDDVMLTETYITLKNGLGKMRKRKLPQCIRYHYVSEQKDQEAYYHRLLILYQPWRDELELKDDTYKAKFQKVKDSIISMITKFEPFYDDVNTVLDNFDIDDLEPEAWDKIASQIEQEKNDEDNIQQDLQYAHLNPESLLSEDAKPPTRHQKSFSLTTTHTLFDCDYYKMVRSLNEKQRHLFDYMYLWGTDIRLGHNPPKPFYIFLSGGAGVGKSHLINTIYQALVRILRSPGQNSEQPSIILTASTGKAAANINGTTLHSAFGLPVRDKGSRFTYRKPSAERLNHFRCLYQNLKVIIADEISMFGATSLQHLNQTLQHICEDYSHPFANISILAVGDLLQLNPVGDQAVFKPPSSGYEALAGSLWAQLFQLYELTEIVRQKTDPEFAEILSRVRIGQTTDADIDALKQLQNTSTDHFPQDALHIYLTNKQVSEYNYLKIDSLVEKITITAADSKRETLTNRVNVTISSPNIYETGNLPSSLTIAKGARLMLTKNIDLSDHLVNGAIGTLECFHIDPSQPLHGTLFVKFDSDNAGSQAKQSNPINLRHTVPIRVTTVKFTLTSQCPVAVERTMFPVVLAYAVTAHKSQGGTHEHLVADLKLPPTMKTVQQGQTYTILSRATSREGLLLHNFSSEKIKVNQSALEEMDRMTTYNSFNWIHPIKLHSSNKISIGFLNIRSFSLHSLDLEADPTINILSTLCLTETHVKPSQDIQNFLDFTIYPRETEHGLAICTKLATKYNTSVNTYIDKLQYMECMLQEDSRTILVAVVYRPPTMNKTNFIQLLRQQLLKIPTNIDIVLGGDFNLSDDDVTVKTLCDDFNLIQIISEPTHYHGNTLDLIFCSSHLNFSSALFPLPYSDHQLVCIHLS